MGSLHGILQSIFGIGRKMSNLNDSGWLQCGECGYGHPVERWEVECGDYKDRTACPECLVGWIKITWESDRSK